MTEDGVRAGSVSVRDLERLPDSPRGWFRLCALMTSVGVTVRVAQRRVSLLWSHRAPGSCPCCSSARCCFATGPSGPCTCSATLQSASATRSTQRSTRLRPAGRGAARTSPPRIMEPVMGPAPGTLPCSSSASSGCLWGCSPSARRCGSASPRVGPRPLVRCPPYPILHQPPHHAFFRCSGSERLFVPVTRAQGT
jgi:hypothetical protein